MRFNDTASLGINHPRCDLRKRTGRGRGHAGRMGLLGPKSARQHPKQFASALPALPTWEAAERFLATLPPQD
jgi:hypothetical protein